MSDFDAIDSLLASVGPQAHLPASEVRRDLRERAGLSKAQVARALGVSPSTVAGWESGRDPVGEIRTKYAYLLDGLAAKFAADTASVTPSAPEPAVAQAPAEAETPPASPAPEEGVEGDEVEVLAVPEPCVLCGHPAGTRVAGFAQHLDPADCQTTAAAPAQPAAPSAPPEAAPAGKPSSRASRTTTRPSERSKGPARRAFQEPSGPVDLIAQAVQAALAEHHGDIEAATAALLKRAIPDAMQLLDETRKGARYDVVAHPWIPDILKKQTSRGADQIWEARPKWTRHELPPGRHEVTALDINGAYLSALKTHLPLGQLEHSTGLPHDRRRAGVHLITPPAWEHEAVLPNPIGQRDEPGPLWVTEPTLRLLLRLSGPKYGLCAPPEVHESYTSGATENLLEKFRIALKDARDTAIADGDEVTLEYVKAMYSKFVSTMGESNYNRELYRPDWMHIIRSQAFANLWLKAFKAHDEGLMVVRAMGTDELHVIGDWRGVFPEGRGVAEVKVKDTYTAGADTIEHTGTEGEEG
ncbi:helix-turn-helix domain-containing protein [Streptomyces roseoverticillatus]|uniref:helix-turn-helix domain-containing protein n=1 Tax=Streptomyces roseoverticillatus TaxID=66429 RepID=UPI001F345326|nr:helix-turn-helix transcriptional regulator [Streptomyces roseoverticillatus]MCF3105341.1 helix-turn-helix domain-containing protein [Streptomyces roseoverticillatus]